MNSFPLSQEQSQAGIEVSTICFVFSDKVVNSEVGMTCGGLSQEDSYFNGLSRQCDRIMGKQFRGMDFCLVSHIVPSLVKTDYSMLSRP